MVAMNKHYSELKVWSVEMPNAPYSNPSNNKNELKNEYKLYEFVWRHKRDACSGISAMAYLRPSLPNPEPLIPP